MEEPRPEPRFLNQLCELIEVPAGTLKGPERLGDFEGWNSIAILGFMSFADKNGFRVSARAIARSTTVSELLQLLNAGA